MRGKPTALKWGHIFALCLCIGCPAVIEAQARKATDADNGLELGIEVVSGEFRVGGGECTVRVWVKNVSKGALVVPDPPLGVDLLAKPVSEWNKIVEWQDYERPDSWRYFYGVRGPFKSRRESRQPGFGDHGGLTVAYPLSKAFMVGEFREFCRVSSIHLRRFRTFLLSPGESRERNVTHSLKHPNCGYFDSGMFYDLDKLGVTPEQQRALLKDLEKDVPIWGGHLYVFLKIPE